MFINQLRELSNHNINAFVAVCIWFLTVYIFYSLLKQTRENFKQQMIYHLKNYRLQLEDKNKDIKEKNIRIHKLENLIMTSPKGGNKK
ncbi:hypothetical protein HZY83_07310 [Gemella sp. GH3]|uniref:hypothetical protein n=1 Tax=unclassified Gemella TaxID=2624949 RepID=UPI0015CFC3A2|nr:MULTISPECIES: hypothetical protein [unclassified Gemella]MBF0714481.1 hypothetical protein [Gemella sp. GH3.1]NYS51433.1 hypothetical protein [Gemella sp. GH3]